MHRRRCLAAQGVYDRYLQPNNVGIRLQFPKLDEVRHHRMETIDGYKFLRKIEWRAKMVDTAIHMLGVRQLPHVGLGGVVLGKDGSIGVPPVAQPNNAWARGEDGIPLGSFPGVL